MLPMSTETAGFVADDDRRSSGNLARRMAQQAGLRVRHAEDITEHALVPFLQVIRDISDSAWGDQIEKSVSSYHLVEFERP